MGCAVCEGGPEDLGREAGLICPGCRAALFARAEQAGHSGAEGALEEPGSWFPLVRRVQTEEKKMAEERLSDLRELADRSRSSMLPPEPADLMVDAPPSLRAAIRTVQLFAVPVEPEPPREWLQQEKPTRGRWLDRAAMVAVLGCSVLVAGRFLQERPQHLSGNTRLVTAAISGPALAYAKIGANSSAKNPVEGAKAAAPAAPVVERLPVDKASVRLGQTSATPRKSSQPRAVASTRERLAPPTPEASAPSAPSEPAKPKAATSLAEAMAAAVGK